MGYKIPVRPAQPDGLFLGRFMLFVLFALDFHPCLENRPGVRETEPDDSPVPMPCAGTHCDRSYPMGILNSSGRQILNLRFCFTQADTSQLRSVNRQYGLACQWFMRWPPVKLAWTTCAHGNLDSCSLCRRAF
jgi:hypothetical protein